MDEDGLRALAATVIYTAIFDWKLLKRKNLQTYKMRRSQVRIGITELEDFFHSTWFDSLADMLGLESTKMLKKLGI